MGSGESRRLNKLYQKELPPKGSYDSTVEVQYEIMVQESINNSAYDVDLRKNISKDCLYGLRAFLWERSLTTDTTDIPRLGVATPIWNNGECATNFLQHCDTDVPPMASKATNEIMTDCIQELSYEKGSSTQFIDSEITGKVKPEQDNPSVKSRRCCDFLYLSKGRGSLHAILLILLVWHTGTASAAADKLSDGGISLAPGLWVTSFICLVIVILLMLSFQNMAQLVRRYIRALWGHFHHSRALGADASRADHSVSTDNSLNHDIIGDSDSYSAEFSFPRPVQVNERPIKEVIPSERYKERDANHYSCIDACQHSDGPGIINATFSSKDLGNISVEQAPGSSNITDSTSTSEHSEIQESGHQQSPTMVVGINSFEQLIEDVKYNVSQSLNIFIPHEFSTETTPPSCPLPLTDTSLSYSVGIGSVLKSFNALVEPVSSSGTLNIATAEDFDESDNSDGAEDPPLNDGADLIILFGDQASDFISANMSGNLACDMPGIVNPSHPLMDPENLAPADSDTTLSLSVNAAIQESCKRNQSSSAALVCSGVSDEVKYNILSEPNQSMPQVFTAGHPLLCLLPSSNSSSLSYNAGIGSILANFNGLEELGFSKKEDLGEDTQNSP